MHTNTVHSLLVTLQVFSFPSIVLLVSPARFSVYDEALQRKEIPTHTPHFFFFGCCFFFCLPLTDNLSPAVSATMKNMLTFPRRALLWHKVMDLRPPRSSDDGSSSSQRGAKLTVYLLLTLRVILHFLPPAFFPVFRLFSCLFLAIFRGFTLEPAYEARLIFQHCLIMTTTSHFTLLSPALFLFFFPFFL